MANLISETEPSCIYRRAKKFVIRYEAISLQLFHVLKHSLFIIVLSCFYRGLFATMYRVYMSLTESINLIALSEILVCNCLATR